MSIESKAFPEPKEPYKIGFRVIQIPLAIVRDMVLKGQGGDGAKRLIDEHPFAPDLTGVSVNESDFSLTIMTEKDGGYKQLEKQSEVAHPEFGGTDGDE